MRLLFVLTACIVVVGCGNEQYKPKPGDLTMPPLYEEVPNGRQG